MGAGRPLLALLSLFLVAGACLLLFLVVLAGSNSHTPLNQIFLFRHARDQITGARNLPASEQNQLHWTLYNVCGSTLGGHNVNCGKTRAAFPFTPSSYFGTTNGIPSGITDHSHWYFILTRILFSFYIITLAFAVFSLLTGLLALCTHIGGIISAVFSILALLSSIVTAVILTVVYLRARRAFHSAGLNAGLGVKAFAFTWTTVALLLLTSLLFTCVGCMPSRRRAKKVNYEDEGIVDRHVQPAPVAYVEQPVLNVPVVAPTSVVVPRETTTTSYTTHDHTYTTYEKDAAGHDHNHHDIALNVPIVGGGDTLKEKMAY